jgi:hypothetical protein
MKLTIDITEELLRKHHACDTGLNAFKHLAKDSVWDRDFKIKLLEQAPTWISWLQEEGLIPGIAFYDETPIKNLSAYGVDVSLLKLFRTDLINADLESASIGRCRIETCKVEDSRFAGMDASIFTAFTSQFVNCDFTRFYCTRFEASGTKFISIDFSLMTARASRFIGCDFVGCAPPENSQLTNCTINGESCTQK